MRLHTLSSHNVSWQTPQDAGIRLTATSNIMADVDIYQNSKKQGGGGINY